jgi:hypothetical protein
MPNRKQLLPNLAGRMRLRRVLSLGLSSTQRLFGCCACAAVGERSVSRQSQLLSVCVNIYKFLVCRQPVHSSHLTLAFKGCLVTSPHLPTIRPPHQTTTLNLLIPTSLLNLNLEEHTHNVRSLRSIQPIRWPTAVQSAAISASRPQPLPSSARRL